MSGTQDDRFNSAGGAMYDSILTCLSCANREAWQGRSTNSAKMLQGCEPLVPILCYTISYAHPSGLLVPVVTDWVPKQPS